MPVSPELVASLVPEEAATTYAVLVNGETAVNVIECLELARTGYIYTVYDHISGDFTAKVPYNYRLYIWFRPTL